MLHVIMYKMGHGVQYSIHHDSYTFSFRIFKDSKKPFYCLLKRIYHFSLVSFIIFVILTMLKATLSNFFNPKYGQLLQQ